MACRLASKCSQTVKSVTCCAGFRSTTEIILIPYGSHATCQYLNGTGSWQVFRGREVRAWDFYLACVGRERKESFQHSADQHRHLILLNGCYHSEYVFESNVHCYYRMKYGRNWWHLQSFTEFYTNPKINFNCICM